MDVMMTTSSTTTSVDNTNGSSSAGGDCPAGTSNLPGSADLRAMGGELFQPRGAADSLRAPPPPPQQQQNPQESMEMDESNGKNGGLATRHPLPAPPPPSKVTEDAADDADLNALSSMMTQFSWSGDAVETCARSIMAMNGSPLSKLKGVQQLKQLLCTSREHVFRIAQDVIESGVLRALVHFVSSENTWSELRHPAAFCLTNIAAGNDAQTAAVVEAGAIPALLELLGYPDETFRRQAIFCLANIAGSTPEFRKALADQPHYFTSLINAAVNATDPKVEELAGWNMRNMAVLGGPEFYQVREGIEFFAEQLHRNSPPLCDAYAILVNGMASLNVVASNLEFSNVPSTIHGDNLFGLFQSFDAPVLRFACETFSWISRKSEGRNELLNLEVAAPLLFQAKFNSNHSVRNHSLECLANLAQFGDRVARNALGKAGAAVALSELLADYITYSPHQRVLAARCLFWMAQESSSGEANLMADASVVTRDVARKFLIKRREVIQKALQRHREEGKAAVEKLARTMECCGKAPMTHYLGSLNTSNRSDNRILFVSSEDDDLDDRSSHRRAVEELVAEAELHGDITFSNIEQDIVISEGCAMLQGDTSRESSVPCASTLEIAYKIFNQTEQPEEFALREKCGRLLLGILINVSDNVLLKALSNDFIRLLLDILDTAAEIDLQQVFAGPTTSGTATAPSEHLLSSDGSQGAASAVDALRPGEPTLPNAAFVGLGLKLLQKLFELGDMFSRTEGAFENPVTVMFRQEGGPQRLESLMSKGPLPFQLIQKAIHMVETYCAVDVRSHTF